MAKVWCAFDERLQVHRAIKVLLPAFATRTMIRQRFLNEARTMARLHHPNIVAVHDVVEDEAVPYMVMELVRGGSLADYLEAHGPMHPRLAADATLAVLAALELAHDEGVIHRDIKPQNILVTAKGKLKVTDFGIARLTGPNDGAPALTRTGSTLGTWGFMAPEQRSSARQADARADVYAVGATLYSLLTNEIPVDLFTAELDDTRITGMPEPLEPIIRTACRYHVHDRYDSCADMAAALREVLPALDALDEDTPRLGGSLGALPTPEERLSAPSSDGNNETLMPPPNTFRLEDSDLPPISRPDPADADASGTGLTRLDVPEFEEPGRKRAFFYGGLSVGLLLMVWMLWPSAPPVAEPPADPPDVVEVTENLSPTMGEVEVPGEPSAEEGEEGSAEAPAEPEVPVSPEGAQGTSGGATTRGGDAQASPKEPPPPAEVEPDEAPEEAPPVEAPPPPRPARVQVTGDARSVVLIGSAGQVHTAGEVPADTYTIKASFGDGSLAPAGKISVVAGQAVTLQCSASFASCKPQ